jgi:hypothetical protein
VKHLVAVLCPLVLFPASFLITGCGADLNSSNATPSPVTIGALQGSIYGGQQPVAGAKVYLFATGITAYGGKGILASSSGPTSNASISLLNSSGSNTQFDGTNYYVLSGSTGSFSISGDYACTPGTQVYLYAVGGNPGPGVNANAGFLAGLGACPAAGNLATTDPTILLNEVTTVATAYALAGFATDATHISTSGSTLAATGIANAMANVANIADISHGGAYTATHATGSKGTVPQSLIFTVADILAACINSTGLPSAGCTTLFNNAKSNGASGITATDTATAAINIAHNSANAVGKLYGNATATSPFQPYLSTQPNDFTLAITYTGNGVTRTSDPSSFPGTIAIDGSNNVWVLNFTTNDVSAFNPLGVPLAGSPFSGNNLADPDGIAVDTNNRIWIANVVANTVSDKETLSIFNDDGSAYADPSGSDNGVPCTNDIGNIAFDPSGNAWIGQIGGFAVCKVNSTFSTFTVIGSKLPNPTGIASDASGNIWVTNSGGNEINKFSSSGTNVNGSPFQNSPVDVTYGVAIDNANNAWIANNTNMLEITSTGSVGSPITGNGIVAPNDVAVDGANNVWETDFGTLNSAGTMPNGNGDVVELTGGVAVSGATGYQAGTSFAGQSIAIDGAGNIWLDNYIANSVRELIGAAVPVVTPLSLAVKNNKLGARP